MLSTMQLSTMQHPITFIQNGNENVINIQEQTKMMLVWRSIRGNYFRNVENTESSIVCGNEISQMVYLSRMLRLPRIEDRPPAASSRPVLAACAPAQSP